MLQHISIAGLTNRDPLILTDQDEHLDRSRFVQIADLVFLSAI